MKIFNTKNPRLLLVWVVLLSANGGRADELRLRVSAGDFDRRDAIVTFVRPENFSGAWVAEPVEGGGARLPLQQIGDGEVSFILPGELAAGTSIDFRLKDLGEADPLVPWVEVLPNGGRLRLSVAGDPVFYYQAEERSFPRENLNPRIKRGGFLHPILSPGGKIVSQSYPERHPHHQGIWAAWTRTTYDGRDLDFWNMQKGNARVEFKGIERSWSGPVAGGFEARHEFVDLSGDAPEVVLRETWMVNLYQLGMEEPVYRVFDLELFQETAGTSPLVLPEYHYGGLAYRGPDEWDGSENAFFLTSDGETDRKKANASRVRWMHMSGLADGERAGLAILDHPDNFRAPQPLRVHPGEPYFCYAPSQLGDWAVTPEEPYRARYRFVVTDGEPNAELIDRLWHEFAHPPEAVLVD